MTLDSLVKTQNCSACHIIPTEKMYGLEGTDLKKATTELAGGLNRNGSSCGAIFGGSLNFALRNYIETDEKKKMSDAELLHKIGMFVKSFEDKFKTFRCKEILGLNLRTRRGQLGLLLPNKNKNCKNQAKWGMEYFYHNSNPSTATTIKSIDHCSSRVWDMLKSEKSFDDPYLRELSKGFSGGIGLSGGACGALSSFAMYLGVLFRKMKVQKGEIPEGKKSYKLLKETTHAILDKFIATYQSIDCRDLTQMKLYDINDFNRYREEVGCEKIYDFISEIIMSENFM